MTLESETIPSTRASGRLERRKARTRAAILTAAGQLFQQQGYEATSIQQIADRADTGVGTVYGYFPSKEHILHEVLRLHSEEAVERYHAAVGEHTPGIERVCVAFATFASYVREYRTLLLAAVQSSARSVAVDDHMTEWVFAAYSGLIQQGIDRGELRPVPVEATVRTLISAYSMAVLGLGIWAGCKDDEIDGQLESVVRGLLAP